MKCQSLFSGKNKKKKKKNSKFGLLKILPSMQSIKESFLYTLSGSVPNKISVLKNIFSLIYGKKNVLCHLIRIISIFEPGHNKTHNKTCATSKESDQPVHPRSLIGESLLIAGAFYSPRVIQWGMNKNPCNTGWMYRLICVFVGHTGLILFCHALAHFWLNKNVLLSVFCFDNVLK